MRHYLVDTLSGRRFITLAETPDAAMQEIREGESESPTRATSVPAPMRAPRVATAPGSLPATQSTSFDVRCDWCGRRGDRVLSRPDLYGDDVCDPCYTLHANCAKKDHEPTT